MKKIVLCATLLLLVLLTAGCSRKQLNITTDDVSVNTMLASSNGELQVATVEDFGKAYYSMDELKQFITKEVDSYNQKSGGKNITVNGVRELDNKAIMLLTYSGMEHYATFNVVTAAYFNGGADNITLDLPATLVNAKNDSLASTGEVLKNKKYKILVLTEPYDIIVDGSVKYYTDNATLLKNNKVQGAAEGMTVVVFK